MDIPRNVTEGSAVKAAGVGETLEKLIGSFVKGSIPLAIGSGALVGSLAGMGTSMLKAKNPELVELARKKKFYDAKIREMKNERWLDDVMQLKRKLENDQLTLVERKNIENAYIAALNK